MPVKEEPRLIGHHRQQSLQSLGGEFSHGAAPVADEVPMIEPPRHRLEPTKPLTEVVDADESTLDQQVERAIKRSGPDGRTTGLESAGQCLCGGMTIGAEDRRGHRLARAGDREPVIPQPAAETLQELPALLTRRGDSPPGGEAGTTPTR